jgi:hypothetical protein
MGITTAIPLGLVTAGAEFIVQMKAACLRQSRIQLDQVTDYPLSWCNRGALRRNDGLSGGRAAPT